MRSTLAGSAAWPKFVHQSAQIESAHSAMRLTLITLALPHDRHGDSRGCGRHLHNSGMPRNYSMGARTAKATAAERVVHPERRSLRERFGGLRNIPPFLGLVWQTSPSMMLAQSVLRLTRALLPVATLYVGKLIIDEVIALARTPHPA